MLHARNMFWYFGIIITDMFVYHFDTTVNEIILFTLFAAGFWISHHGSIFVDYMFNLSLQNDHGYVD